MNSLPDLHHIEQQSWRSHFRDGLTEISLGLLFIAFAFAQIFEQWGLPMPWNILIIALPAVLVPVVGKRVITQPRVGRVKFGPHRKTSRRRMLSLSIATTIILVTLVTLTALGIFPGRIADVLPGLGFMAVVALGTIALMSIIAYILDYPRLALIGIIVGVSVMAVEILREVVGRPWHFLIGHGTAGLIMLALGLVLLIRFLREYPLISTGDSNAG
jgi:hypothetical protein